MNDFELATILCKSTPEEARFSVIIDVRQSSRQRVALFPFHVSVVPQQLIHTFTEWETQNGCNSSNLIIYDGSFTASEGEKDQHVDEEELDDVDDHSAQ